MFDRENLKCIPDVIKPIVYWACNYFSIVCVGGIALIAVTSIIFVPGEKMAI